MLYLRFRECELKKVIVVTNLPYFLTFSPLFHRWNLRCTAEIIIPMGALSLLVLMQQRMEGVGSMNSALPQGWLRWFLFIVGHTEVLICQLGS